MRVSLANTSWIELSSTTSNGYKLNAIGLHASGSVLLAPTRKVVE